MIDMESETGSNFVTRIFYDGDEILTVPGINYINRLSCNINRDPDSVLLLSLNNDRIYYHCMHYKNGGLFSEYDSYDLPPLSADNQSDAYTYTNYWFRYLGKLLYAGYGVRRMGFLDSPHWCVAQITDLNITNVYYDGEIVETLDGIEYSLLNVELYGDYCIIQRTDRTSLNVYYRGIKIYSGPAVSGADYTPYCIIWHSDGTVNIWYQGDLIYTGNGKSWSSCEKLL